MVLLLTAILGIFSITQLASVNEKTAQIKDLWMPSMGSIQTARFYAAAYRIREARHFSTNDPQGKLQAEKEIEEILRNMDEQLKQYQAVFINDEDKENFADFVTKWEAYRAMSRKILELSAELKSEEAAIIYAGEAKELFDAAIAAMLKIVKFNVEGAAAEGKAADDVYASARTTIIGALILALALGMGLALVIARIISRPIVIASEAAKRLTDGDLTVRIESNSRDEVGTLMLAMQEMVDKLTSMIREIRSSADSLASASEEVSATAQSMSQATSEQAASVEETSASMEQMSASINQNTENAKVTDGMASKAAKEATEGGEAVQQTVSAMKQIAQRISIIDDIAYQTNLLALNAAIEAARAGEHGKGFAVVAAEVRKLAERSQIAAQEIGELSGSSVELAEKAGRLLDEIVPSITKTSDLVQEISAASEEQASGVGQINMAMTQLNQVTQQNASSSEELAATSEEMSSQAEQLQQVVSFFRLDSSDEIRTSTPSASARREPKLTNARTTQPVVTASVGKGINGCHGRISCNYRTNDAG